MSLTAPTITQPTPAPAADARRSRALLACAALAGALVLGSGAVRWWQVRQVEAAMRRGREEARFDLDQLPMSLGDWVGEKTEMDPQIVARTGSDELLTRRYTNRVTGVVVEVIVLHGPASDIFIHTPEVCYPRAGYASAGDVLDRSVPGADDRVPFRSAAYTKGDPARADTQEVYFSWRYNGRWSVLVNRPKEMERISGMYKVQVSRRLLPSEARTVANPCEAFLELLVPALEARIRGQAPPSPAAPGA